MRVSERQPQSIRVSQWSFVGGVRKAERLSHWPLKFPESWFNVNAKDVKNPVPE